MVVFTGLTLNCVSFAQQTPQASSTKAAAAQASKNQPFDVHDLNGVWPKARHYQKVIVDPEANEWESFRPI
jgi:hypothetical protein